MIGFGHTSTGILIGVGATRVLPENTSSPIQILIVILLGIVSHYLADFIPHGHYVIDPKKPSRKSLIIFALDTFGTAVILLGIALYKYGLALNFWLIFFAILGAQLPDIWQGIKALVTIKNNAFVRFETHMHNNIAHWHNPPHSPIPGGGRPWAWTDAWQICILLIALLCLLYY